MWPGLVPEPVSCLIQNVLANLNLPPKPTVDNAVSMLEKNDLEAIALN